MDRPYPGQCAHELIEAQAKNMPDALALVCEDRRITFERLNSLANECARRLRGLGVRPEVMVGGYLLNSPEAIIGLLGVLKAGGVFVPMDASYPQERLRWMIEDSRISLVLTHRNLHSLFLEQSVKLITVDDPSEEPASRRSTNIESGVTLDNAAFVIYTSGSTGKPKGVVRLHRGVVSRLAWSAVPEGEIHCHNMSLNYGFSQERLLLPLMCGRPLVIIPDEITRDVHQFVGAIEAFGVTSVTIVPGYFRQLLSLNRQVLSRLRNLRSVTVGSAAFPADLIEPFRQILPDCRVINAYGAAETGSVIRRDMTQWRTSDVLSVGQPLPNVHAYIVDSEGERAERQDVAELCLGAPSLARGYLNRPELTAARFVPNKIDQCSGERLYRTGDRGRFLANGEIQLVGRADRQVKISGFRVELGEVEAVLIEHEAVNEAVVVAGNKGVDRLVAYVTAKKNCRLNTADLRGYLRQRLPIHMVPSEFVRLEQLPVTPNGKVDIPALPAPSAGRPELNVAFEPPRNPLEDAIAEMWMAALQIDQIGIHDSFRDLGGESLALTQIVARLFDRFGVELPNSAISSETTVATLAAQLVEGRTSL